ncbi:MAG: WD40 repeat domain-containing protein, partial [Verrucomicrobiota bacterium]
AQKQAGIAEANTKLAIEEKESARRFAAKAHMALAAEAEKQGFGQEMQNALEQVPEDLRTQHWDYIRRKLDTSTLSIKAKGGSSWLGCLPHPLDSEKLLTLQRDGWVRALTPSTETFEDLFQIDKAGLKNGIAVSRDGRRLAVWRQLPQPSPADDSFQFDIFNLPKGEPQSSFKLTKQRLAGLNENFVFSPDGNLLLINSAKGPGFHMFDASSGALLWEGSGTNRAFGSFSKDGRSAFICTESEGLTQRNPATGEVWSAKPQIKLQGWKNINEGSPSADSIFCVTGAYCLRIETVTGKTVARFPLPSGALFEGSIAYLPERNMLAVLGKQTPAYGLLQFWDATTGDLLRSMPVPGGGERKGEDSNWSMVRNLNSGDLIITRGTEMKIWRLPRPKGDKTLPIEQDTQLDDFAFLHKPDAVAGAFRPSNDLNSSGVVVGIMSTKSRESYYPLDAIFTTHQRRPCILTTDRSSSLICTQTQKLEPTRYPLSLFRLDKAVANEIPLPEVFSLEGHAHLSPKGDLIWAGNAVIEIEAPLSGAKVRKIDRKGITEPPRGERTPRWVGDRHVVEMADFKTKINGSNSSSPERHLLLWDVTNGERAAVVAAPFAKALSASPDGTQIAEGGSDKMLRIRDKKTLVEQRVLRVHDGGVSAVAWHPKLPMIATASEDRTVKIWNLETQAMVEEFGFLESLDRLFWSPDGTQLGVRGYLKTLEVFSPKSCQ